MGFKLVVGALAIAIAAVGAVPAQAAGEATADPVTTAGVPTVTIINKAPERSLDADEALPPALPESAPDAADAERAEELREADEDGDADAADLDEEASEAEAVVVEPPPEPTLAIDIDLTRQAMTVSDNGQVVHSWPISSARYGYRTPTGSYQPTWMARMWHSRQYDYSPMPHAIFFHKGVAIHGSYATRMLGRPASHGCVRLAPKNAATLFKMVSKHGKARTAIFVHGTPDHSSARVAARERPARRTQQVRRASPYGYASAPPPGAYYNPRARRYQAAPQRRHQPRGLFNSYSSGYGY